MKIQKAKLPLEDGKKYYLPVIFEASMEPMTEGGGYFSTPGGRCLMLSPKSVKAMLEAATQCNRCKDCAHAQQSQEYARNIFCEYKHPGCSWDKMSKACGHYEPRKEQE